MGQERLIYLMRVTEIPPMERYFTDPRFAVKKASAPADTGAPCVSSIGDNIYESRDGVGSSIPTGAMTRPTLSRMSVARMP